LGVFTYRTRRDGPTTTIGDWDETDVIAPSCRSVPPWQMDTLSLESSSATLETAARHGSSRARPDEDAMHHGTMTPTYELFRGTIRRRAPHVLGRDAIIRASSGVSGLMTPGCCTLRRRGAPPSVGAAEDRVVESFREDGLYAQRATKCVGGQAPPKLSPKFPIAGGGHRRRVRAVVLLGRHGWVRGSRHGTDSQAPRPTATGVGPRAPKDARAVAADTHSIVPNPVARKGTWAQLRRSGERSVLGGTADGRKWSYERGGVLAGSGASPRPRSRTGSAIVRRCVGTCVSPAYRAGAPRARDLTVRAVNRTLRGDTPSEASAGEVHGVRPAGGRSHLSMHHD